jgi:HSP20 family molecular chaperone IbpA
MIIDTFFDDVFKHTRNFDNMHLKYFTNSKVNETENGFEISIAVPGVDIKDLSVELDATKNQIIVELIEDYSFVSKFKKGYEIPKTIDLDTIEVSTELGVLSIRMERKKEAAKKKLL